jgi:hypothetical protein
MLVPEQLAIIRNALESAGWKQRSVGLWCWEDLPRMVTYTLRMQYVHHEATLFIFEDGQTAGSSSYHYRGAEPVTWLLTRAYKPVTETLRKYLTT